MLALVCSLAVGVYANNGKAKKAKKNKQCTEQTCKPGCNPGCKPGCKPTADCKPADCNKPITSCAKA